MVLKRSWHWRNSPLNKLSIPIARYSLFAWRQPRHQTTLGYWRQLTGCIFGSGVMTKPIRTGSLEHPSFLLPTGALYGVQTCGKSSPSGFRGVRNTCATLNGNYSTARYRSAWRRADLICHWRAFFSLSPIGTSANWTVAAKQILPVVAASREPIDLQEGWTIGLDVTSVMVLSHLGLLEKAIGAFHHTKLAP